MLNLKAAARSCDFWTEAVLAPAPPKDPALYAFVLQAIQRNLQHIDDILTEIADLLTVGLCGS